MAYALSDTMTIRSGIGRFLNRPQINTSAAYGFNPPLSEMATVINGNVDAPAGAQRRTFPLVMAMFSPDYANASSWAWNVTMDRQLPWQHTVQLSYVGRSASNLERARNINQLQPGTMQANPGVNANALRPYKGFGTITLYETTGRSRYNAMQLQVQRRAARGVRLLARLHVVTHEGRWQHPARDPAERLRRQRLLRHLRSRSAARADHPGLLPDAGTESAPAVLRGVLGDWNIGGVFQAQSGAPFDVTTTVDIAGVGPGSGAPVLQHRRRPERGPHGVRRHARRVVQQGRRSGPRPPGTYATTWERNNLRQPGFWDLHMSLRKSVAVGTHRVELRWDVFNVLNHTNLGMASDESRPLRTSGRSPRKTGNRTMQIGLQYVF